MDIESNNWSLLCLQVRRVRALLFLTVHRDWTLRIRTQDKMRPGILRGAVFCGN